jgi:CRISPR-associated endonuclease/helicase Cas3
VNATHLLVYHCLDVAAVAKRWLEASPLLCARFAAMTGLKVEQAIAWVLFFIAIHDLGKFDLRFQLKVLWAWERLNAQFNFPTPDGAISRHYWHGEYAAYWVFEDLAGRFDWKAGEEFWEEVSGEDRWIAWQPWIRAVAGHHGIEPREAAQPEGSPPLADPRWLEHDRAARIGFIQEMESLFLKPAGLSLDDTPPPVDLEFLAGFCSVCDWLGSTTENQQGEPRFIYHDDEVALQDYLDARCEIADTVLRESGLLARSITSGGMRAVFPQFQRPHQVQTLVDKLPLRHGLTVIEAPTGSGKTEAALAYAARLLAAGEAESVIFALPTQATADAMLERLTEVADRLFNDADVVLAHGKSRFNPRFIDLKKAASRAHGGPEIEAGAQCALWLAQSRKRVFLGQIGVCTVDQVLVSALPVRHRFVRGFGLGKSVLIIDEVHAYDAYMYGLLDRVLRHQRAMGSSAILLSATLPLPLRRALLASWDADDSALEADNAYPLITQATANGVQLFPLPQSEQWRLAKLPPRIVKLSWAETPDMLPDKTLEQAIIDAAENGANVAIICNLVADAQRLAQRLADCTDREVLLFHSRYRFKDRQKIQQAVMARWGKDGNRPQGSILVATQVIEQSLDLDFDWMITQLCPIDLLFQRLGRLQRHDLERPAGFEEPACTVLLPEACRYELHKLIYGNGKAPNSRVLWRTEQMVRKYSEIDFSKLDPSSYRSMIEAVYDETPWADEPEDIVEEFEQYWQAQYASRLNAQFISDIENAWNDDDSNVNLLTRDGEMSLNIVPVRETPEGRCFLDEEQPVQQLEAWEQAERIMLNTLPAPHSWQRLGLPVAGADGLIWLVMEKRDEGWSYDDGKVRFIYHNELGLDVDKQ